MKFLFYLTQKLKIFIDFINRYKFISFAFKIIIQFIYLIYELLMKFYNIYILFIFFYNSLIKN